MQDTVYIAIESLKQSFFGISIDTIFTTFITIFIFIIGFLIHRYYENKKNLNNLKDVKSFFLIYIESMIEPFEHFIDSIQKLSDNLKDINNRKLSFSESAKLTVDENIVNQLELFKAFVFNEKTAKEKRIIHLKNLLNALITIKKVKVNLKDTFFKFNDDLRRYEHKLMDSMNFISRQYDLYLSIGLRSSIDFEKDLFLVGFKKIISEWNESENKDFIDITKTKLINPTKDYCTLNIQDERALHLIPATVDFNNAFLNIETLRNNYTGVFSDVKNDLDSEYKKIKEAVLFLK